VSQEALMEEMMADVSCWRRKIKKLEEKREKLAVTVSITSEEMDWWRRLCCSHSR